MRSFLINKNLSFYYRLKKGIGKTMAFEMAKTIERSFLIFGREQIPRRRVRIYKKVKRLALLLSIKKSILWCKLMNYAHPIKNHKFGDGSEILTDL